MKKPINNSLIISSLTLLTLLWVAPGQAAEIAMSVSMEEDNSEPGRLFISFRKDEEEEPRFYSSSPEEKNEAIFAMDIQNFPRNTKVEPGDAVKGFPYAKLKDLPAGEWYVQALYDRNQVMADINAEGNLYSDVIKVNLPDVGDIEISLQLSNRIPDETLPVGDSYLRFEKFRSTIISEFWGKDMFLRASVLLPSTYYDEPNKKFPVYFDVGGFRDRYDRVIDEEYEVDEFQQFWFDDDTPQIIIIYLDGEAPLGDSYQVNSANNGPYGDATWEEFIPYLESKYRMVAQPQGRFISGCSTGGWVTLASLLFRPDYFNGAWSLSPDSPDFSHFQLVNLYEDDNAYANEYGHDHASQRTVTGEMMYSIRQEVAMESVLGRGDNYLTSAGQWGGWNAIYGPGGEGGLPVPVWDQESGIINNSVVEHWKQYDLQKYMADHWDTLSAKINGKLFFWMGDMDGFYLNNGLRALEAMLQEQTDPVSRIVFEFLPETDHCDFEILDMRKKIINEMMYRFKETI